MNIHNLIRGLREPAATKIVLVVADGLGGLPLEQGGKTELETARTPNLDLCVREGVGESKWNCSWHGRVTIGKCTSECLDKM